MREDAHSGVGIAHVKDPQDVGILRPDLGNHRRFAGRDVLVGEKHCFILEGAIVAVRHAVNVEADHFATIGDDPEAVFLDGGRGANPDVFPVAHLAGPELGHRELPEEAPGFLVEAHENALVTDDILVPRRLVVGADEDLSIGHCAVPVGLRARLGDPADVPGSAEINFLGLIIHLAGIDREVPGIAHHVAGGVTAPGRPVFALGGTRRVARASRVLGRLLT